MHNLLLLQQKIVPELIDLLKKRYTILRTIYYKSPVGRRALAAQLGIGERVIRSEVNFLRDQGLIYINSAGMTITEEGQFVIDGLKDFIHELKGLSAIEDFLKSKLEFEKIIVVPGDSDDDPLVIKEMGRIGAHYVKNLITDNLTIAVTGGSSVAELVNNMQKVSGRNNIIVVPARGGMGKVVETQANIVASNLANKLNASYRLLHVPDVMRSETLETMLNEPGIKEIISKIRQANLLIFGIGRADEMAKRRGYSIQQMEELQRKGAVAEAFGYYFDRDGNIVEKTSTIGVKFEDVKKIDKIVAVAGGKSKAEAIIATRTYNKHSVLITDEGASREMMRLLEGSANK